MNRRSIIKRAKLLRSRNVIRICVLDDDFSVVRERRTRACTHVKLLSSIPSRSKSVQLAQALRGYWQK